VRRIGLAGTAHYLPSRWMPAAEVSAVSGIPEDVLTQIFNPFFTSKENGTGLGLVVCKRIIQSYGGKIQIKSKSNEGTEVELCIPLENNSTNEM
jgi:signal transduction histidine kinase